MLRLTPSNEDIGRPGFDSAIKTRAEDHLNRWPLALEIYGIATTGPADWSVRIGIYGEWGTGKTSVLEFIAAMADRDKHTLIRFNPWQHATKDALWRAFVLGVYSKPIFSSMERAGWVRIKKRFRWFLDRGKTIEAATGIIHKKAGKAVGAGFDLAKGLFAFGKADLPALRKKLGDGRVIVLIDDLDRTAPELVPEILFALKELMDAPQFSFICAFDPVVVGKVLRRYHPGFGDGLKFLEKVIDYPRWLPPAPAAGLVKMALTDAKKYCPYVPEPALREVVPLLPPNPRAVRQFIRLLALLGQQINRHYDYELRWPVILAANALKVRYPLLGHDLLSDGTFLGKLQKKSFGAEFRDEQRTDKKDIFPDHVKQTASRLSVKLSPAQENEIVGMLEKVFSAGNVLLWIDEDKISYQLNIAEAPHAVTWKEYDHFLSLWHPTRTRQTAESWMNNHAQHFNCTPSEVQREVFQATVRRYAETLRKADAVLTQHEKTPLVEIANSLVALLECLTFDLGQLNQPEKRLNLEDLELLFEIFASITNSLSQVHAQFQPLNEQILLRLVREWSPDLSPLLKVLQPYGHFPGRHFDQERTLALHRQLCAAFLPNLAAQVLNRFHESGFITELLAQERETFSIRGTIFDPNGPMWTTLRSTALGLFKEADTNQTIQENAYELIHLFDYKLHEVPRTKESEATKALLSDQEVLNAIWGAAIATPLSPQATGRLRRFVKAMKTSGATVQLPPWWDENIKALRVPATPQTDPENGPGQTPEHDPGP